MLTKRPHCTVELVSAAPEPSRSMSRPLTCAGPINAESIPRQRDLAERTVSSSSGTAFMHTDCTRSIAVGLALSAPSVNTDRIASYTEAFTALPSACIQMAESSVSSGSIRIEIEISFPRAVVALLRTSLLASFNDLMKVVCSWGTNAFNDCPPLSKRMHKVCRIAPFTLLGNLSPITRIRGPVALMSTGLSTAGSVIFASSPMVSAATSLTGTLPFMRPCSKIVRKGSSDLGIVSRGSKNSPVAVRRLPVPVRCLAALAVEETQFRMNSTWLINSSKDM
mmetsp:Transcript_25169/g.34596  ORF Transcript_25169/g.34596 Transcript_25169/m.34596 type:complete len:280 (-) Transcript_25169:2737-3576(-)